MVQKCSFKHEYDQEMVISFSFIQSFILEQKLSVNYRIIYINTRDSEATMTVIYDLQDLGQITQPFYIFISSSAE